MSKIGESAEEIKRILSNQLKACGTSYVELYPTICRLDDTYTPFTLRLIANAIEELERLEVKDE